MKFVVDKMLKTNILQSGIESDSIDQLQNKLKRYSTEIESLRGKGIGKFLSTSQSSHTLLVTE